MKWLARPYRALLIFALAWPASLNAQQATVVRDVNLRGDASTAHPPIRLLVPPETLTLLAAAPTSGYYHVRTAQSESGWVWGRNISVDTASAAPLPNPGGPVLPPPGTYAADNTTCPATGEHSVGGSLTPYSDNSDAGLRNLAKRHIPVGSAPVTLTLAGFGALQEDVNNTFADAHHTKTEFQPDRHALTHLAANGTTVDEGELVQVAAYLTAVRAQGPESVNCAGNDGADIHLNVGPKGATEWQGIVVEMIPQLGHPVGWDVATLNKVRNAQLLVLVVGGLTYDNEHLVNDDSSNPNGTQPKRISLWEIHPVTAFYICPQTSCDPGDLSAWTPLTTWASVVH